MPYGSRELTARNASELVEPFRNDEQENSLQLAASVLCLTATSLKQRAQMLVDNDFYMVLQSRCLSN